MLLSRVAESVYWAARYLERADDTARLVHAFTNVLVDLPVTVTTSWRPLLAVVGSADEIGATDLASLGADERTVMGLLLADPDRPSSVLNAVSLARENLRSVREVLPPEVWTAVNDLHLYVLAAASGAPSRQSRVIFCDRVVGDTQQIEGIIAGTMLRDEAYDFYVLGRMVERADMTTRILGVQAAALIANAGNADQFQEVRWMGVLQSMNARQAYQRITRSPIDGALVVRFVLDDRLFPRSVRACLDKIGQRLTGLPRSSAVMPALVHAVDVLDDVVREQTAGSADGRSLDHAMDEIQLAIADLHAQLTNTFVNPQ